MANEQRSGGWTIDEFRPFVESALNEWKRDMLIVETGLRATDTILTAGEDAPSKSDRTHPYNKIINVIVEKMVQGYNLNTHGREFMTNMLHNREEELTAIIWAWQRHPRIWARRDQRPLSFMKRKKPAVSTWHQSQSFNLSPKQPQTKEDFEKKKRKNLDSLPNKVKARFGQQYFAKWGKSQLPVLVLSPYRVKPGRTRDRWLNMYEKFKKSSELGSVTNLVYCYGYSDDPVNAYSLVQTSDLTPYPTTAKKKKILTIIPKRMQKKIDNRKMLCNSESRLLIGLREMEEDRTKKPEERHGLLDQTFLEDWERTEEQKEIIIIEDDGEEQVQETAKPTATSRKSRWKHNTSLDSTKTPNERHGQVPQAFLEDLEQTDEEGEIVEQKQVNEKPKPSARLKDSDHSRKRAARLVSPFDNKETAPSETRRRPIDMEGGAANTSPTSIRKSSITGKRAASRFSLSQKETIPSEKRRRPIVMEDHVANNASLQPRLDGALSEIERLNDLLAEAKQLVHNLDSQIESKNKDIVDLNTKNESLEEEMEQMRMNYAMEQGFAEG